MFCFVLRVLAAAALTAAAAAAAGLAATCLLLLLLLLLCGLCCLPHCHPVRLRVRIPKPLNPIRPGLAAALWRPDVHFFEGPGATLSWL
jgi:hypothetical protein